jgi:hypothetical protein
LADLLHPLFRYCHPKTIDLSGVCRDWRQAPELGRSATSKDEVAPVSMPLKNG